MGLWLCLYHSALLLFISIHRALVISSDLLIRLNINNIVPFKPQRAMGLGHSTSPVLSTHVNLLCKDANKFTHFFLSKKHMHWGSSMHARRP